MASKKKSAADVLTPKAAVEQAEEIRERAEAEGAAASTYDTVVIGLNFPLSIEFEIPSEGGGTKKVTINGNAVQLRGLDMGVLPTGGQFGLTFGVKKADWEAIVAKYHGMPIFRSGLIFAVGTAAEAKKEAGNRAGLRNGYEPVDPTKARTQPKAAE